MKKKEKDENLSIKKILLINYEFPPLGGGGGVASYDLAVEWAKSAQVDVLTSAFKDLPLYEKVDNINIYRVRVLGRNSRDAASFISMLTYLINAFFKGMNLCRENRYNIINTHFAVPSGPLGFVLGKLFHIKNILSLHGGDIYDPSKKMSPHKSPLFSKVVRFILNKSDAIVAQSSNTKNNAIKYYKPKKDISIIPLAYHPVAYEKVSRKEINLTEKDFVIVTVGRLVKRKSIDTMIDGLSHLKFKSWKLVIIGDGPEKTYLEKMSDELQIRDKIIFTGFVSDEVKYQYLQNADIFAMTSLHEGFGIVFMEAMFCGLPIIATNNGGQVDFLKDEENALLIDVKDSNGFAHSVDRLHKSITLANKMGKNNKKKISEFYADEVADQYIKLFNEQQSF